MLLAGSTIHQPMFRCCVCDLIRVLVAPRGCDQVRHFQHDLHEKVRQLQQMLDDCEVKVGQLSSGYDDCAVALDADYQRTLTEERKAVEARVLQTLASLEREPARLMQATAHIHGSGLGASTMEQGRGGDGDQAVVGAAGRPWQQLVSDSPERPFASTKTVVESSRESLRQRLSVEAAAAEVDRAVANMEADVSRMDRPFDSQTHMHKPAEHTTRTSPAAIGGWVETSDDEVPYCDAAGAGAGIRMHTDSECVHRSAAELSYLQAAYAKVSVESARAAGFGSAIDDSEMSSTCSEGEGEGVDGEEDSPATYYGSENSYMDAKVEAVPVQEHLQAVFSRYSQRA